MIKIIFCFSFPAGREADSLIRKSSTLYLIKFETQLY